MTTPRAEGLREAVEALPFRRMTGEGLANFGTTGDLFVDWDEYEDVVSKAAVLAALAASSTAPGLDVALDNLATHHELERIAGNTHSRPDRCEFVEQARAALAASDTAPDDDDRGDAWGEQDMTAFTPGVHPFRVAASDTAPGVDVDALENDLRELWAATPAELARRLSQRGWLRVALQEKP